MRSVLRWFVVLWLPIALTSCIYGRKSGGGTNIGTGSADPGRPWDPTGGPNSPALTGER